MGDRAEFITESYAETENVGAKVASLLRKGRHTVCFYGDLGAGKTAFVRGMGSVLCPSAFVCSPTFSVINEYKENGRTTLCHVDAYRITDDDDLYSTGFYDCLDYDDCTVAIEWSENIPFAIPRDSITVTVEKLGENRRRITVEGLPGIEELGAEKT